MGKPLNELTPIEQLSYDFDNVASLLNDAQYDLLALQRDVISIVMDTKGKTN